MSRKYSFVIDQYWITQYIQYLQEIGVVPGCSTRAGKASIPLGITPSPPSGLSYEYALLWNRGKSELSKWLSFDNHFSEKRSGVLH
jgi:hypothetical protein